MGYNSKYSGREVEDKLDKVDSIVSDVADIKTKVDKIESTNLSWINVE